MLQGETYSHAKNLVTKDNTQRRESQRFHTAEPLWPIKKLSPLKTLVCYLLIIVSCSAVSYSQGLEIYLVYQRYPNFTIEYPDDHCYYCLDLDNIDFNETALVSQSEILSFDWQNQVIELSDSAIQKLRNLNIPLQGLAVAFAINKKPIYGFWLWQYYSSFVCDRAFAYVYSDSNILTIRFRKEYTKGEDPRYNDELRVYLINLKLID